LTIRGVLFLLLSPHIRQTKLILKVRHPTEEVQILQVNSRNGSPYKVSSMLGDRNGKTYSGTHRQGNSLPIRCSQTYIPDSISTVEAGLIKGTCSQGVGDDYHFESYVSQEAYTSEWNYRGGKAKSHYSCETLPASNIHKEIKKVVDSSSEYEDVSSFFKKEVQSILTGTAKIEKATMCKGEIYDNL
tara:strand:+ start:431 stop:991 length:561 start_codon:yes stop_codon:yes gene_type:complete